MTRNLLSLLLLLCNSFIFAQNASLEILLIGVSHDYPEGQQTADLHRKILHFKPDAFFGEWLSPEDEKATENYWNKENINKRTQRLMGKRSIDAAQLPALIAELKQKTVASPSDFRAKVDLAHALYLWQDAGNAHFQMWQLSKELKRNPSNRELFDYAKLVLSPKLDSIHKVVESYALNEHDLIVYPMMMALGHREIFPMDCQRYDEPWSAAWALSDSLGKLYEARLAQQPDSPEALLYAAAQARDAALMNDTVAIGYGQSRLTEILNTPQADEFLLHINICNPFLLSLEGYPAEAFQAKMHWWMMRNITMCRNTVERARAHGFKKVTVVVGAGHRMAMEMLFSQMPGVKVWNVDGYEG